MDGYLIRQEGSELLTYSRLSRHSARTLYFAGESLEVRSCFATWYEANKPPKHIKIVPTIEDALPSLHFRAYRNLQKEGYSIDDVAGYVIMQEKEVRARLLQKPNPVKIGKDDRVFGAKYYLKKGREKHYKRSGKNG